jgi:hypothetical protein
VVQRKVLGSGKVVKKAFFMKDRHVRFRHEGEHTKVPKVVYLAERGECYDLVLVFSSASGSGKTVELAASSVTRHACLTLITKIATDIEDEDIDEALKVALEGETRSDIRNKLAFEKLKESIAALIRPHSVSLDKILDAVGIDELTIVVALDEGSSCPLIVRSIISNRFNAKTCLKGLFPDKVKNILFSIAGTGVASPSIGSDGGNFRHLKTWPVGNKFLYPRMALEDNNIELIFPGGTEPTAATMGEIETRLPILSCMMENARMASIALMFLHNTFAKQELMYRPIDEGNILQEVARLFMNSNGLQELREEPIKARAAAACAFAMMLFQCTKEDSVILPTQAKVEEFISKFECGVQFDKTISDCVVMGSQALVRKRLLATYGLLEPNQDSNVQKDYPVHRPFIMPPSQQLIAMHLLGIDFALIVAANPFGFEVLSTHTMKVALAASSVVAWQSRKLVADTLELVGCKVDKFGTHEDAIRSGKNYRIRLSSATVTIENCCHGRTPMSSPTRLPSMLKLKSSLEPTVARLLS